MIIYFHILITNPAIQWIMTDKYRNRDGNGVVYTIGGQNTIKKMNKNLMG